MKYSVLMCSDVRAETDTQTQYSAFTADGKSNVVSLPEFSIKNLFCDDAQSITIEVSVYTNTRK